MHLSIYVYVFLLHTPMQCTFGLFPLRAYCLATRGGAMWRAFMSEAIMFEWTSAQPPAKHKHLTIERNIRKRLKHSTIHDSMSLLFLEPCLFSPCPTLTSWSVCLSDFTSAVLCLPLLFVVVPLSPSVLLSDSLCNTVSGPFLLATLTCNFQDAHLI